MKVRKPMFCGNGESASEQQRLAFSYKHSLPDQFSKKWRTNKHDLRRNANAALKIKPCGCWCQSSCWRTATYSRLVCVGWHILLFLDDKGSCQVFEPQTRSIHHTDCRRF